MPLTSSARQVYLNKRTRRTGGRTSGSGRYCCESLFALLIKNSLGCRRDLCVKMWGTSSPDRKLTGDLGNAIESTEIDGRRSRRPLAGKLSPGDFRLLQQYRPCVDGSHEAASGNKVMKLRNRWHRMADRQHGKLPLRVMNNGSAPITSAPDPSWSSVCPRTDRTLTKINVESDNERVSWE